MSSEPEIAASAGRSSVSDLEARIQGVGQALGVAWGHVLDQIPEASAGPQKLAAALGIDKVLASRLLKSMRSADAMTTIHRAPGPDPMRRVLRSTAKLDIDSTDIDAAKQAIDQYEHLIRAEIGDRSELEAILSAWVPEARREFESRRKQTMFRAISQLKGMEANVYALTNIWMPSADGKKKFDFVVLTTLLGLKRLRPGVPVYHSMKHRHTPRRTGQSWASNLDGEPVDSLKGILLPAFSTNPLPKLEARRGGQTMYYHLGDAGVGAGSAVDLVSCEVHHSIYPSKKKNRLDWMTWSSLLVNIPSRVAQFDSFAHDDIFAGESAKLRVYDSAIRGSADWNNPDCDSAQFDLLTKMESLGRGLQRFGSSHVPRYRQILADVFERIGQDANRFRGFRVTDEFPIQGSQFTLAHPDPYVPEEWPEL